MARKNRWPETVDPKPLRRFITPIGFGAKVLKLKCFLGFSLKPFLKRLALKLFFKKACEHAVVLEDSAK